VANFKFFKLIAYLAAVLALGSCGGDSPPVAESDGILSNLQSTNLNSYDSSRDGYWEVEPEPVPSDTDGLLKRWAYETGLIPVQLNGSTVATQALDEIENKLGLILFDRFSLDGIAAGNISRGIIVSEGTAVGPGGPSCGNVSVGPNETNWFFGFYDSTGEISATVYVNLGSAGCQADLGIAIHEFGHALGAATHFVGFGIGPPIDNNFWNVLYNIYNNNVGTPEVELVITKMF